MFDTAKAMERKAGSPELAKREISRYGKLKSYRQSTFDASFQVLSNYYLPNMSDINTEKTEGTSGWVDRIFDTTAIEAARTCTTGQGNWATPAAEPWFAYTPPKILSMDDDDDGAIWTGICTEIALDELSRSNYYTCSGTQYKSRCVFGTGHLHIEEGRRSTITCVARKIGTYCIAKDDEGFVDTIYSEFKMSARALGQKFPEAQLSEKIRKALTDSDGREMDKEFDILHVIRPREEVEREPGKIDAENKPIASIYIAMDDKVCIDQGGYDEMPDSVTRFDDWGTFSPYGYSPAFEILPNVRQLNYIVRFTDAQYELRANPRILEPINYWGQVDLRPGGRTPYDPNQPNAKPEEWMTQADITGTEKSIDQKQKAVNRMFYTDVFTMLQQIDRKMTAYEISQRIGEKLEQIAPMFYRIIDEKTSVDLKRVFGILFRAGKFPKPPRSMYVRDPVNPRKGKLAMPEITYTSRLALALKALQNKATMDTMQFMSEFAQSSGHPEIMDNWDLDAMARTFSINQGMSPRFERPMRQVINLRANRAKQAAQERAMQLAHTAADAAGKLGRAPQQIQNAVSEEIPSAGGDQSQAPQAAAA